MRDTQTVFSFIAMPRHVLLAALHLVFRIKMYTIPRALKKLHGEGKDKGHLEGLAYVRALS
jgi:hypothetical protein